MKRTLPSILAICGVAAAVHAEFVLGPGDGSSRFPNAGQVFEPDCVGQAMQLPEGAAITLDGLASEAAWASAAEHAIVTDSFPTPGWMECGSAGLAADDLSGSWRAVWDGQYLYLFVDITDDLIMTDSGANVGDDDNVEIFIDGDSSRGTGFAWNDPGQDLVNDWQIVLSGNGRNQTRGMYDASKFGAPNLEATFAIATTDTGWSVEVRLPWMPMISDISSGPSFPIAAGAYIGLDVKLTDDDDSGGRDNVRGWCSCTNEAWASPDQLGTLQLAAGSTPGLEIPVGQWLDEPNLGWVYGYEGGWAYSLDMGWIYYSGFPWIYQTKHGWMQFVSSGGNFGWYYSPQLGWLYVPESYGNFFQVLSSGAWLSFM